MSLTKDKHHEYMSERLKNDKIRSKRNKAHNERRCELKQWFFDYKSKLKCIKCGENPHPAAMDFHHPNHDNEKGIYRLKIRSDRTELLKELSKCVPVCANCHRIIHWEDKTP